MLRLLIIICLTTTFLTCPDKDERCIACNGSECIECVDSFRNSKGLCVAPKTKVDRCVQYKLDGVCQYCVNGYHVDPNGKCVKISIPNCAELASKTSCAVCSDSTLVANGRCDSGKKCKIANCDLCALKSGKEVCVRCNSNYVVSIRNGVYSCKSEINSTNNCLYLNSVKDDLCAVCDYNYYMRNHTCQKSTKYHINIKSVDVLRFGLVMIFAVLFK